MQNREICHTLITSLAILVIQTLLREKVMRCPGCQRESFLYGIRDVRMDINDSEKVVPVVKGSHCLTCGRVIIDEAETATFNARLQAREVIDA